MPGLEAIAAAAGKAVVERAVREGLAARTARAERGADLTTLIQSGFPDRFLRRSLERQLEAIADGVERRLAVLVEREYGGLAENDRTAVLHEVVATVQAADLSDGALLAADMDPIKLAKAIRAGLPDPARQLGEAGARLFDMLLDECLDCLVRIVQQLPQYLPRAGTELLGRVSAVDDRLATLGQQVSSVLARLPARSLDAPSGTRDDDEFLRRYLGHISTTLDEVELFGVRVETYRPRATLSVAYISLNACPDELDRGGGLPRARFAELTEAEVRHEPVTSRVESALGRFRRVLLRGGAGSGKSTLLRWLAVTATRGGLTGDLAGWNDSVPFVIKLRSHGAGNLPAPENFLADVARPVAGLMPEGWAHRVLGSGRALLMVDGVDELSPRHRPAVRRWLDGLLAAYPEIRVIVTSRPAAADARWLEEEGFSSVTMEPMTPVHLRELVRQWHTAMRGSGNLPFAAEKLDEYEGALLARFESSPYLQTLASTPLLAAMLCALNLDRGKQLPRNRMGLYAAALELLLQRRDAERGIVSEVVLEPEQKVRVLQDLAWQLGVWGRSELSRATALKRVEEKIQTMPRVDCTAEVLLDHLLQRSGVIREPVPGRIDFVHRTVQEYLAAKQAADGADVEPLIERAHLDQWRETVVMAAGHANAPLREELLRGLLRRVAADDEHARRLCLLVIGCLETIQELPRALSGAVEECFAAVIPPRDESEAGALASAGEEVLRRLPDDLAGLSSLEAAATVRTCWLINGAEALERLARYSGDSSFFVQRELITAWDYFDPEEYARRVMADSPLIDRGSGGHANVENPRLFPHLRHLRNLEDLWIAPRGESLEFLGDVGSLRSLNVPGLAGPGALDVLSRQPGLEELWVSLRAEPVDSRWPPMPPSLRKAHLFRDDPAPDLRFLDRFHMVEELSLDRLDEIADFTPLASLTELRVLSLFDCHRLSDPAVFGGLLRLTELELTYPALDGIAGLVDNCPNLRRIALRHIPSLDDITPLASLALEEVTLSHCVNLVDLTPLSGLRELRKVSIRYCEKIHDLSPLKPLRRLKRVNLIGLPGAVDVAPLAGKRDLVVKSDDGQELRNADLLDPTAMIYRL
ncbi:NACHT domain-containing protein [Streptosporangium sp. NBC_01469]|uniref:NACHT domain-containing protein n=1 Tax=Streptosporangium sp. NBC_01469 TaxID=2903898 RepID=UPI002E2D95B3|nr:NACHT domain-containing protein [Streptosporangium sp. NBC_01469]